MQDFSGLGILLRIIALGLRGGEKRQHATGDRGIVPETLQRRDDAVAPEWRAEPRNAGVGVRTLSRLCPQQVQVGDRALDPIVELIVRGHDLRRARPFLFEGAREAVRRIAVPHGSRRAVSTVRSVRVALDQQLVFGGATRLEPDVVADMAGGELGRRRIAGDMRPSHVAIEAFVRKLDDVSLDARRTQRAAPFPVQAPHLEQVGEIGIQLEYQ